MFSPTSHSIHDDIKKLSALVPQLPESVAYAEKDGMISHIFASIPIPPLSSNEELHWQAFNCRMDILLRENVCKASDGKLLYIQHGPFGMDLVLDYIVSVVNTKKIPFDIAAIKVHEVAYIIFLYGSGENNATIPIGKRMRTKILGESEDEDYEPLKRFDGEETEEDTEAGMVLEQHRSNRKAKISEALKIKEKEGTSSNPCEVDSGNESDGKSALHAVEE
ncbi:hypothetical protein BDQ17DRAFT_1428675 [Cyathus striatus]|nr:hypothetical protein BDQ17DRAFT_1428675 [Cyathus striatus]